LFQQSCSANRLNPESSLMTDFNKQSSLIHRQLRGKISIVSKLPVQSRQDLSVAYTPGVAGPCELIAADPSEANDQAKHGCGRQ
jgi:malate dehydrogenase (oxaloacetate-decarboxylating)